ncbi:unnamed protein product [Pedinophyceae sp. YPF-701]|nr:unnamed protein product [Pedinophyceae sp. YPF-701]
MRRVARWLRSLGLINCLALSLVSLCLLFTLWPVEVAIPVREGGGAQQHDLRAAGLRSADGGALARAGDGASARRGAQDAAAKGDHATVMQLVGALEASLNATRDAIRTELHSMREEMTALERNVTSLREMPTRQGPSDRVRSEEKQDVDKARRGPSPHSAGVQELTAGNVGHYVDGSLPEDAACASHPGLKVWMRRDELSLLTDTLKPSDTYLEWGSGGSTALVPALVSRAFSVEGQPSWCAEMHNQPRVACFERSNRLQLTCPALPPGVELRAFGYPVNPSDAARIGRDYIEAAGPLVGANKLDVVLVDGRFRVACALYALQHLAADGTVFVHDWPGRPHYHALLDWYELVGSAGEMVALKPRRDGAARDAKGAWLMYATDPR